LQVLKSCLQNVVFIACGKPQFSHIFPLKSMKPKSSVFLCITRNRFGFVGLSLLTNDKTQEATSACSTEYFSSVENVLGAFPAFSHEATRGHKSLVDIQTSRGIQPSADGLKKKEVFFPQLSARKASKCLKHVSREKLRVSQSCRSRHGPPCEKSQPCSPEHYDSIVLKPATEQSENPFPTDWSTPACSYRGSSGDPSLFCL